MHVRRHTFLIAQLIFLGACSEGRRSDPVAVSAQTVPQQSHGLLTAAIDHFAPDSEGRLQVDPCPLRADADVAGISIGDIAVEDAATAELRASIVRDHGLTVSDAADDHRCTFAGGLRVPDYIARTVPDSLRRQREACLRKPPYTTLIFGLPEPAGAERPGVWKLEAVRMTTWSYHVWDLYLRPAGNGAWSIVETEQLLGIMS